MRVRYGQPVYDVDLRLTAHIAMVFQEKDQRVSGAVRWNIGVLKGMNCSPMDSFSFAAFFGKGTRFEQAFEMNVWFKTALCWKLSLRHSRWMLKNCR